MALQKWDQQFADLTLAGTPAPGDTAASDPVAVVLGAQFASIQYVKRSGTWAPGESMTMRLEGTNLPADDPDQATSWEVIPASRGTVGENDNAVYAGNADLFLILPYRFLRLVMVAPQEPADDAVIGAYLRAVFEVGA